MSARKLGRRLSRHRRLVRHYGPWIGEPGGMSAVLESYQRMPFDGWDVDIVPTWRSDSRTWSADLFGREVWRLLSGTGGRPAIAHVHLSTRGSFLREGGIAHVAAAVGCRVVASLHGSEFPAFLEGHPTLVRRVLGAVDVVCPLGPATAEVVAPFVAASSRIEVLPNPIAVPADTSPAGDQDEVVVFGGAVGTRKGVDVLLEAWKRVHQERPQARLLIAGPEEDVSAQERPGIEWLGPRPRAEVHRLLEGCRVAVLPSRAEVMPMFLLEAMARARPVVTTDIAEVPWLVGESGSIVPVGDPDALAEAVLDFLASPVRATQVGAGGRRRAVERFSDGAAARHLERVYAELV